MLVIIPNDAKYKRTLYVDDSLRSVFEDIDWHIFFHISLDNYHTVI